MTGHHFFGWLPFCSPYLHVPISQKTVIKRLGFSVGNCWVGSQDSFHLLPSPHSPWLPPIQTSTSAGAKTNAWGSLGVCLLFGGPGGHPAQSVHLPFSPLTLLPLNHPGTLRAGPTVLSTGCLFAGTAFQVSKLKTSADNPNTKMKKGGNPWAVLLMPNKVYLYSKIATGYLSLQQLKRLGSLNSKILSLWEVEIQASENGHQKRVLRAPSTYFMVSFHKWSTLILGAHWTAQRANVWLLSHKAKELVKHIYIEVQGAQPKLGDQSNSLRSLSKFLQSFQSPYMF